MDKFKKIIKEIIVSEDAISFAEYAVVMSVVTIVGISAVMTAHELKIIGAFSTAIAAFDLLLTQ